MTVDKNYPHEKKKKLNIPFNARHDELLCIIFDYDSHVHFPWQYARTHHCLRAAFTLFVIGHGQNKKLGNKNQTLFYTPTR